jgi:hypothetical protein
MGRIALGAYPSCSQARDNYVLFRTGQSCQIEETLSVDFNFNLLATALMSIEPACRQ